MATIPRTANEKALDKVGKANQRAAQAAFDKAIGGDFFDKAPLVIPKVYWGVVNGNPYIGKKVFAYHSRHQNGEGDVPWAFKANITYIHPIGDVEVEWKNGETKFNLICKRHVWPVPAGHAVAPFVKPTGIVFGGALAPKAAATAQRVVTTMVPVLMVAAAVAAVAGRVEQAEVHAKAGAKRKAGKEKAGDQRKQHKVMPPDVLDTTSPDDEQTAAEEPKQYKDTAPDVFNTRFPGASKVSDWCQEVKIYRQNVIDGKFPSDVCYDKLEQAHALDVKNIAEIKERLKLALAKVTKDVAVSAQLLADANTATGNAVEKVAQSAKLLDEANKRNAVLTSNVATLQKRLDKAQKAAAAAVDQLYKEGLQRGSRGRQLPPKRFSVRHEACAAHQDPVDRAQQD